MEGLFQAGDFMVGFFRFSEQIIEFSKLFKNAPRSGERCFSAFDGFYVKRNQKI